MTANYAHNVDRQLIYLVTATIDQFNRKIFTKISIDRNYTKIDIDKNIDKHYGHILRIKDNISKRSTRQPRSNNYNGATIQARSYNSREQQSHNSRSHSPKQNFQYSDSIQSSTVPSQPTDHNINTTQQDKINRLELLTKQLSDKLIKAEQTINNLQTTVNLQQTEITKFSDLVSKLNQQSAITNTQLEKVLEFQQLYMANESKRDINSQVSTITEFITRSTQPQATVLAYLYPYQHVPVNINQPANWNTNHSNNYAQPSTSFGNNKSDNKYQFIFENPQDYADSDMDIHTVNLEDSEYSQSQVVSSDNTINAEHGYDLPHDEVNPLNLEEKSSSQFDHSLSANSFSRYFPFSKRQ